MSELTEVSVSQPSEANWWAVTRLVGLMLACAALTTGLLLAFWPNPALALVAGLVSLIGLTIKCRPRR